MLSSERDLREKNHLRSLLFNSRLEDEEIRESQDDLFRRFNSICESVTSKPLVVEVGGLFNEPEGCNRLQVILLALHQRIDTLSIFLSIESFTGEQNSHIELGGDTFDPPIEVASK